MDLPENPGTIKKRKSLSFRIAKWFVPKFFYIISFFIFGTSRFRYHNKHFFDQFTDNRKSIIFGCYHYGILLLPFLLRHRYFENRMGMVSKSPEGDYIAITMNMFGQTAVRGSSTRGGKDALNTMIERICEGNKNSEEMHHGLITVDGPKGPRHETKMGIIKLAKETGLPIVPCNWFAKPTFQFKNWDRTIVPFPFSKIVVVYDEPVWVPENCDEQKMEELRCEVNRKLTHCYNEARKQLGYTTE